MEFTKKLGFKKTYSLRLSLSLGFFFVVLLTATSVGITTFILTKNFFRANLEDRLRGLASNISSFIDGAEHAQIKNPQDEGGFTYLKVKRVLQKFKEHNPDIRYIYTMRKAGEKIQFVVDAESNPEEMSHVGDIYEDPTSTLIQALNGSKEVQVEQDFSTDQWGTWLSAFAPLYDQHGQFDGIIGIDVAAESIKAHERELALYIFLASLSTLIIALLIGMTISNRISNSLTYLASEVHKVENLDLSDIVAESSAIKEVMQMSQAVDGMKKGLRSFKKFVPSDVVIELMKNKKEAVLGAEKRELTVLFSDIADFTTISEKLTSEQLSLNLGRYLQEMSTVIKAQSGTIDKFIGDAIMAFWGAPQKNPDHPRLACLAALNCLHELKKLNAQLAEEGYPVFNTRIGINTGECIVGNIGHDERLSYTAIGDHVNLASRLEDMNKMYETNILLSENCWNLVQNDFEARVIDSVVVKGKTNSVLVYELVAIKGQLTPVETKFLTDFSDAMKLVFDNKLDLAERQFKLLLRIKPSDRPTQLILERIVEAKAQPSQEGLQPRIMRVK